jgi:hypothetical protein
MLNYRKYSHISSSLDRSSLSKSINRTVDCWYDFTLVVNRVGGLSSSFDGSSFEGSGPRGGHFVNLW